MTTTLKSVANSYLWILSLPSIKFSLVLQEENQRVFTQHNHSNDSNETAFTVKGNQNGQNPRSENSAPYRTGKKERPVCTYCNYQGHTRDKCYKLHRYPIGSKQQSNSKKTTGHKSSFTGNLNQVGADPIQGNNNNFFQSLDHTQVQQLMSMFSEHLNTTNIVEGNQDKTHLESENACMNIIQEGIESTWKMSFRVGNNTDSEPYPERPGEPDCAYYLRSGYCIFGMNCRFNHPPVRKEKLESASSPKSQQEKFWNHQFVETSHQSRGAMGSSASFSSSRFGSPKGKSSLQMGSILPVRPGQPECPLYIQTGDCEFGANCRFDHPRENMIRTPDCLLNPMGYPLRPGQGKCIFYSRYGLCKFGSNCKFDHSVAAPKSIVTDSILTSASSGLPALTLSFKGSPVAGPSKSRHFPSSN